MLDASSNFWFGALFGALFGGPFGNTPSSSINALIRNYIGNTGNLAGSGGKLMPFDPSKDFEVIQEFDDKQPFEVVGLEEDTEDL